MRHAVIVALVLVTTPLAPARAAAPICMVSVLRADELPFAPFGSWLVQATLQIAPQAGAPYQVTLSDTLPWQKTLRRGDRFAIRCDRFEAGALRLRDLAH